MSITLKSGGKYLKATDFKPGMQNGKNFQIQDITEADVSSQQDGSQMKNVMFFAEPDVKPLILNATNTKMVMAIHGEEPADYLGKSVRVFNDPNVTNPGGQMVGGIRLATALDDAIPG